MMTFKDLKKLVELPSYKEQRVPTVKALEVSGVPVVTEKVLENHGSINVYQNGYVIYRAHKRVTVFSLRDCVHYSETDLIYPAELQEEEQYRRYFKEALELEILEQGYPADKAVLYEILELLVETVTSRKKFLRICGEDKPKEVVKSRLMKLDSSHIQYILECLKENSTQIRNIKQYLLATLYNAPVTVDSYYSAQVRHEFGWGGRVDKN